MAQDKNRDKGNLTVPNNSPSVPVYDSWPKDMPRPIHESNNNVSNTLRPKTGNPPIGKEPGKK